MPKLPHVLVAFAVLGCAATVLTVEPTRAQTERPVPAPSRKAGEFFKNVTTAALKELSVDDFVASMGVVSAALGFDCADCHPRAGTDRVDWVVDTPPKRMARRMIDMVAAINRGNFGGVQKVTCWTCHHGRSVPATSIMMDAWYGAPNSEVDDLVVSDPSEPTPEAVFDKYVQALGGTARLATLTSWVAKGTSLGYGGLGGDAALTIYAKAPDKRMTQISYPDHPERPTSMWAFDGRTGWIRTPRALLPEYELAGQELDGQRFDAELAFPASMKQSLTNWRAGSTRSIDDREYRVVQGNGPRGFLATLYFDRDSGLLSRVVRYGSSPIGHVLTQIDYADYREVAGIKFPFELKVSWLDGRYTAKLANVQVNAPIDDGVFARQR